jgi:hypothetical protein
MTKWEYMSVRFNYVGMGIKQEFDSLDVNGERLTPVENNENTAIKTLPAFLNYIGEQGWELVNHTTESGWHYMHFKRPKSA